MVELKIGAEEIVAKAYEKFIENDLNVPKKFAHTAFKVFIEALTSELELGKSITIKNFGTFKVSITNARKGRNPQTGAVIQMPAGRRISFKASPVLKKKLCK